MVGEIIVQDDEEEDNKKHLIHMWLQLSQHW